MRFPGQAATRPPFKLLSVLLQYPGEELRDAEAEIAEAVASLPGSRTRDALAGFWAAWATTSWSERARHYVEIFDLQKRSSLNLTFYLHGDKRQRGIELLRLKRMYAAGGLVLESEDLPDYLPVMLEFAALAPGNYGETILAEYRSAIEVVRTSLRDLGSPYELLLDAVCAGLPRLSSVEIDVVKRLIADGPPHEEVGLEPFAPPEVMPATGARR